MKTMRIGELKRKFSQVLDCVKKGEKIVISYGKRKENIAVIVPYAEYQAMNTIRLGVLLGKASYKFSDSFEMTPEELLPE